jgi:hypothetical protein
VFIALYTNVTLFIPLATGAHGIFSKCNPTAMPEKRVAEKLLEIMTEKTRFTLFAVCFM